nr:MAG TPA: Pardaxin [Bacteriophage sp.]
MGIFLFIFQNISYTLFKTLHFFDWSDHKCNNL